MSQLLKIFGEKIQLITNGANFLWLVDIVRIFKYEQFAEIERNELAAKYYDMYKNEYNNTSHVFGRKVFDGRYNLTTLYNGLIVEYCDTLETLTKMCQKIWSDRELVILCNKRGHHKGGTKSPGGMKFPWGDFVPP